MEGAGPGAWVPPDEALAQHHYAELHPHHRKYGVWRSGPSSLKGLGLGVSLYFDWLRVLALVLLLMSLLLAASIAINIEGDGFDGGGTVELTTLGNVGPMFAAAANQSAPAGGGAASPPETPPRAQHKIFGALEVKKSLMLEIQATLDLAAVLLFLGAAGYLAWAQARAVREAQQSVVSLADYSVRVDGLPPHLEHEHDLHTFMQEKFGMVVDVQVARSDGELIALMHRRKRLQNAADVALAKKNKLEQEGEGGASKGRERKAARALEEVHLRHAEVTATNIKMRELQRARHQPGAAAGRCVAAFVTFREPAARRACMRHAKSWWQRVATWEAALVLEASGKKHRLRVSAAPSPTDVLWENLEYSAWQRRLRRLLMLMLKWLCLLVSFGLLTASHSLQRSFSDVEIPRRAECAERCAYGTDPPVLAEPLRGQYEQCRAGLTPAPAFCAAAAVPDCYFCWCQEEVLLSGAMLEEGEAAYCDTFLEYHSLEAAKQASQVVFLVAINYTLQAVLGWAARFEKHHTSTALNLSLTAKIFTTQFANTALLLLFVNARWAKLVEYLEGTAVAGRLLNGEYADLDHLWYEDVGASIVLTAASLPLCRTLAAWGRFAVLAAARRRRKARALTQPQLNAAHEGPEFELSLRYGEALTLLFVCLLYSGGIPALVPVAALGLAAQYWTDKVDLLKVSREPVRYGPGMAQYAVGLLPWAALAHLVLAAWAFSFFDTGADSVAGAILASPVDVATEAWGSLPEPLSSVLGIVSMGEVEGRVLRRGAGMLTVACALLLAGMLLYALGASAAALLDPCLPQRRGAAAEELPPFDELLRTGRLSGPASYDIYQLSRYADAFVTVAWEDDSVVQLKVAEQQRPAAGVLPPDPES